jgi:hypothetical protein
MHRVLRGIARVLVALALQIVLLFVLISVIRAASSRHA